MSLPRTFLSMIDGVTRIHAIRIQAIAKMRSSQKKQKRFTNFFIDIELELEINKLCISTRTKYHYGQSQ